MNTPEQLPEASSLKDAGRKIREIITYLRSLRLTAGQGIRLDHYAAGTTISLSHTPAPTGKSSANEYTGGFRLVDMSETVKEKDEDGNEVEKVIPKIKIAHSKEHNDVDLFEQDSLCICSGHGVAKISYGYDTINVIDLSTYYTEHALNMWENDKQFKLVYVYAYLSTSEGTSKWKNKVVQMDRNSVQGLFYSYDYTVYAGFYCSNEYGPVVTDIDKGPGDVIAQIPIGSFRLYADGTISDIHQIFQGGNVLYIQDIHLGDNNLAKVVRKVSDSGVYLVQALKTRVADDVIS